MLVMMGAMVLLIASLVRAEPVELHWLDGAPSSPQGASFGVPWAQGKVTKDATFETTAKGKQVPAQTWNLAYWPDGTVKWTGVALCGNAGIDQLTIAAGKAVEPITPLKVTQTDAMIEIANGGTVYRIPKSGNALIDSVTVDGRAIVGRGELVCTLEDRSEYASKHIVREESFGTELTSAKVEQSGSVRVVVKLDGRHKSLASSRAFLPFSVRLYFYAGAPSVRMVHSFVFDGDQEKDFIRSLGVRFDVPLRDEAHNRHVRFGGDTGMFAEPVRVIAGRRNPSPQLYAKQVAGQPIPKLADLPNHSLVEQMAVWDSYKLSQVSDLGFGIEKRTNDKSAWIKCMAGSHAMGTAFVGDSGGGLAVGMKDFWQMCPTGIEISGASTKTAQVTMWMWSPDAPAMDLRHYDTVGHDLEASYEDYQPGFASATGIARTHELTITPFASVPENQKLVDLAKATAEPAHLVCSAEYYHSIPVFGVWSLPDRSTAAHAWLEDQLAAGIAFYQGQVKERHWYGFWDFGDFMHSYDATRHEWRYDIGGYAWANSELVPDMWLWYSFMRTGRGDIFRMAEAMTRETQEVDVYHLGRFAGLGSRHNVRHWGDGAKEIRISQAALKRFYYYLTTDERNGDLMDEVIDADQKLVEIDPLREVEPGKIAFPTHIRVGPDWFAACGNWMTAWERTGDTKYRDRIVTGMKNMAAMPHKLFSGDSYGYDPATHTLHLLHPEQVSVPHLANLMGGPEVVMEMTPLINLPEWTEAWLNYCLYLQAPRDEQVKEIGGAVNNCRGAMFSRMTGYAARETHDPKLAARAWNEFLGNRSSAVGHFASHKVTGADVPEAMDEISNVSTNDSAQWSLNAIELLELIGKNLPENGK
jgi:hypothetical protein